MHLKQEKKTGTTDSLSILLIVYIENLVLTLYTNMMYSSLCMLVIPKIISAHVK